MSRISIPVTKEFLDKYSRTVPWGLRDKLVRRLIEIAISSNQAILYDIAYSQKNFVIVEEKEGSTDAD